MGNVTPSDTAAQLALKIRELERRIDALTTARNTRRTTIAGGQLAVADADGNTVARFGRFDVEQYGGGTVERLGIDVVDPDSGLVILRSTLEDGATAPRHEVPWVPFSTLFQMTTSGTFVPLWITRSTLWPSSGVFVGTNIGTTVGGTSWEARLKIGSESTGNFYTDTISGTDAAANPVVWRVDLVGNGYDLHDDLGLRFDFEVRRTAGTGSVYVELPYPALAHDATTEESSTGGT